MGSTHLPRRDNIEVDHIWKSVMIIESCINVEELMLVETAGM